MTENNHAVAPSDGPADPGKNVVTMDGQPLAEAPAVLEMEQKRKVFQRAAEIILHSLERDALNLEKAAILGEHTIQRRHELMDTARCLRVCMTWMAGPQANPAEPVENKTEPPLIQTP